ncbi:STAS domain-containing protein [Streptomyces sp. MP131-18]|uniref:STAS domain-containing protein n=1 Tax=Streptomyces sp. MP131-18 TaxID=1857892 RepID=UPI00097C7E9E|nr:STAS domain-containing protein [Streptomyces sp. MP131-18]ONK14127.1 anti-anti-sigma factor [Streptomyces sp. MP131-18]
MTFHATSGTSGGSAVITLSGDLTGEAAAAEFRGHVEQAVQGAPRRLVLDVRRLPALTAAGLRCIAFAQQHLPPTAQIFVLGATPAFRETLRHGGLAGSVTLLDEQPRN